MKKLLPLLLGLLAAGPILQADPTPAASTITAVTVYTDRAVVTRTASLDLPAGVTELAFANLPAGLDDRSLQVSGQGTAQATILDVSAKRTYVVTTPNPRAKQLEDELKALLHQNRGLDERGNLLNAQAAMLDQMQVALFAPPAKDVPRPDVKDLGNSMAYLTEQKAKLATAGTDLDAERETLKEKIAAAQAQLNELRDGTGGKNYQTVTVRVSAPQAGRIDLALAYAVPGAGWTPGYDARVQSAERTVSLGYFGIVRQNTGEDWNNVALTLSTARPGLGGAAPQIEPWSLDVFVARAPANLIVTGGLFNERAAKSKDEGYLKANLAAVNMQSLTSNAPAPVYDATAAQATVEAAATSASFKIAAPASVPSDNSPQKVPITTAKLAAAPEYLTVPKLQATAYLTAKVFNNSDFPLLAGAMNVFLDGTFVATSPLRTVMAGEKFDLALGADEGISVKHKRVKKFTEDTGLTNSGKRITYEYLITIQNNKKTAERVIVADQVPLSRNEKIVVKLLSPDAREIKPTDEGTLKWTLDLKPAEKRELTVKFTVDYPNDIAVTGLE
ncbi:MAG: mucoidy inhibitor MuiA family protein [Verrucomicrobia bacterium]|nr:mucoidy inhibitor MuiA family protein [Verrucomicrobiota bacterium]